MAIIKPRVTSYGSSYGEYGGKGLHNYKAVEPKTADLHKSTEKDTVEFKEFQKSIKDFVLARLGHPTVRVELTDFQMETCIEEATSKLDYHSPSWATQYASIDVSAGFNVYELPPEVANNLIEVWYKKQLFSLGVTPGSLEYDFTIMFFTNTGLFNTYNVSQYLLMQQYLKQIRKVLGQGGTWRLINGKYLHLFPVPTEDQPVIIEFRGIDADAILPAYKNWLQRYSLACCKEILGRVRSKFQTLPGPGGGAKLDGEILLNESRDEKVILIEELMQEIEEPPLFDIM